MMYFDFDISTFEWNDVLTMRNICKGVDIGYQVYECASFGSAVGTCVSGPVVSAIGGLAAGMAVMSTVEAVVLKNHSIRLAKIEEIIGLRHKDLTNWNFSKITRFEDYEDFENLKTESILMKLNNHRCRCNES